MTKYHPALVALHWIMAIMILMGLFFGKVVLSAMDNADPEKAQGLAGHMIIGILVGVLLIVRLIFRFATEKPPHAKTGYNFLDQVGAATHWILYILVGLMVASGLGTALTGGLFAISFGGSGDPIPAGLNNLVPRIMHGLAANLLILILALHIAAALYHQFFLKDGLFRRMWFGKHATLSETKQ
ncbi:MAG: cytochrome b/b6 domain-containing protein [Pseudomonadota bacterium]